MGSRLRILNSKQVKQLQQKLNEQFGIPIKKLPYVFLESTKGKFFITNRKLAEIDINKIKVNNLGLYVAAEDKLGVRLTIEGSQLWGKEATKNILEINQEQLQEWFTGKELQTNQVFNGFVLIKHKKDFLGSGKYTQGRILNYLGKERYVKFK